MERGPSWENNSHSASQEIRCSFRKKLQFHREMLAPRPTSKTGDLGICLRIIIKWILQKQVTNLWTGFNRLRTEYIGEFCEHDDEQLR